MPVGRPTLRRLSFTDDDKAVPVGQREFPPDSRIRKAYLQQPDSAAEADDWSTFERFETDPPA
jgi:hypothetical protein